MKKPRFSARILLSFFAVFINTCYSVIVSDIEEIRWTQSVRRDDTALLDGKEDPFSKENKKERVDISYQARVLFFDTEEQCFLNDSKQFPGDISYISLQENGEGLTFPNWFSIFYENGKLKIDLSGYKQKEGQETIIRTSGFIVNPPNDLAVQKLGLVDKTRPNSEFVYFPSNEEKTTPLDFLNGTTNRTKKYKKNLISSYYFSDYEDGDKFKARKRHDIISEDRGDIGELATDFTMQALGFIKMDGKYKGATNNGFDGVFYNSDIDTLILSESKFWEKPPKVEDIKNSFFINIKKRLNNIAQYGSDEQKETGEFITSFIKKKPNNIYALPYIILGDGAVKCEIIALKELQGEIKIIEEETVVDLSKQSEIIIPKSPEQTKFENSLLLTPKSSPDEKNEAWKDLIKRTSTSPEEALTLMLKALNIETSSKDQTNLFKILGKYEKKGKSLLEAFDKLDEKKKSDNSLSKGDLKEKQKDEKSE